MVKEATLEVEIGAKIDQFERSLGKVRKDLSGMEKKLDGVSRATNKASTAFSGMAKKLGAIGAAFFGVSAVMRGIRTQMVDAVRVGRAFEKEWANVTTMLSISREETEKMRQELRRLSPTLGDTTDLARGMYQVLSASIEPAKAIRLLGTAARSAKAGITDTKTAVDAITTVINAYGLEAEAATEISDLMFGAVKRGKLTYEEMAHALGTVVPVAATLGIQFKEIAAGMATLTRQGIDTSTATMQLRQMLMSVLKASDEVKQKARELGFEFTAQALEAKGLGEFLFDLKEATGGNAELLKVFIPDVRALSGVMALAGKAAAGFASDLEFLEEVSGFTDEALAKQMETLDFWVETFKVAADKIKISAYEGFVDPLRETIRTTEDFDEKVTDKVNRFARVAEEAGAAFHKATGIMADFFGLRLKIDPFYLAIKTGTKYLDEHTVSLETMRAIAEDMVNEIRAETEALDGASDAQQGMTEMINTQLPALGSLRFNYETLGWELVEYTEILKQATEAQKEFGQAAFYEMLPPAKSIAGILEAAAWQAENFEANIYGVSEKGGKDLAAFASQAGAIMSGMGVHNKALAYAGAVISTAAGVAKAIPNIPLMVFAAAAGAAQLATIAGTSIPSADTGAYLSRDTLVQAHKGEIISPISIMKETFRETIREGKGSGIYANPTINIYARSLDDRTIAEAEEKLTQAVQRGIARAKGYY